MSDGPKLRLAAAALVSAGGVLIAACATGPDPAREAELREEGQALASELCAACHAIGEDAASPNADAPALRTVLDVTDATLLAQQLREGLPIGHTGMPRVVFDPHQVDAFMTYLQAVNE